MRHLLARGVALMGAVMLLNGIASAQSPSGKVVIVTSFAKDVTDPFAKAFQAANPGTKVEILSRNTIAGVAFVRGLQGKDPRHLKTVATIKHYAVHSGPEPARHAFDAVVSERDLRDTYLPAFEAGIREGGAASLMSAYNAVNGIPAPASTMLLVPMFCIARSGKKSALSSKPLNPPKREIRRCIFWSMVSANRWTWTVCRR